LLECYKIEQLAADVYSKFANKSSYSETVRETFRNMASDELEHARIIDQVMQMPEDELEAFPRMSEEMLDEKLRLAKALLVGAMHSEMSADDALRLALQAEEYLVDVHANQALAPLNAKLEAFFKELSTYDSEHVDTLRAYLDS